MQAERKAGSKPKRKASKEPRENQIRANKKPKTELGGRFKYSSFNQQLSNIDVGSSTLLQSASTSTLQAPDQEEEEDLLDSEFGRALQRIRLLDTSSEFVELSHLLAPLCRSLPLILLHRAKIVQLLIQHLPSVITSYPIELVSALVDTGSDLVLPDVVPILDCLVDLAFTSQDAEIISKALNAVGHLFRAVGKDVSANEELRRQCWSALAAPLAGLAAPEASESTGEILDQVAIQENQNQDRMELEQPEPTQLDEPVVEDDEDDDEPAAEDGALLQQSQDELANKSSGRLSARQRRSQRGTGSAHLRHLLATAFAYFVRKCANHPAALEALVRDMSTSLSEQNTQDNAILPQSVAWVLVESAKSANSGLHSRFSSLFKAFAIGVNQHQAVIERALVGLIHHLGPTRPEDAAGDKDRHTLCHAVLSLVRKDSGRHLHLLKILVGTNKSRVIPASVRQDWFKTVANADTDDTALFADLAAWSLVRANVADLASARQDSTSIVDKLFELPIELCMNATVLLRDHWKLFDDFVPDRMASRLLAHAAAGSTADAIQKMAILQQHQVWTRMSQAKKGELAQLVASFRTAEPPESLAQSTSALAAYQLSTLSCPTPEEVQGTIAALLQLNGHELLQAPLLAVCLQIQGQAEGPELASEQLVAILKQYGSNAAVLEALLAFKSASAPPSSLLYDKLFSQVDAVRLASARLLQQFATGDEQRAAELIVDVEEVPLTFHEARERCLKLRRLSPFAKSCASDEARTAVVYYLTGCLKINFKPVWSEAITGLVELAAEHGDLVWQVAGQALLDTAVTNFKDVPTLFPGEDSERRSDVTWDIFFEDRSLQQLEKAMSRSLTLEAEQPEHERVNPQTFEAQLLSLFSQAPGPMQKHSRQVVPLYLELFGPSPKKDHFLPSKLLRQRLSSWLDMFGHLKNPKALFQADLLFQSHLRHLTQGDVSVQKLALTAVLTWKQPTVTAFSDRLYALLDNAQFRDTLLEFNLAPEADVVPHASRADLLPIVIRLFYGLLTARHAFAGRRLAVLQALRQCTSSELDIFIDLMLGPFEGQAFDLTDALSRKALGFLSLLSDVLKHLAGAILPRVQGLGSVILKLAESARAQEGAQSREIQRECLKRVVDLYRYAATEITSKKLEDGIFKELITPRLDASESSQLPGAIIELAILWADSTAHVHLLQLSDDRLLPSILKILQQKGQAAEHGRVCELISLLASNADEGSQVSKTLLSSHASVLLQSLSTSISAKAATQQSITDDLSKVQLRLLTQLAPLARDEATSEHLCSATLSLLRKPHKVVPERFKQESLQILTELLTRLPIEYLQRESTVLPLFALFSSLRQRNSRLQLAKALEALSTKDTRMKRVAALLTELNAYSTKRSEEPDFARRLPAFAHLNDDLAASLSAFEWIPILHNLFYLMHDLEEMSIRGNASLALRRFVTVAAQSQSDEIRTITSDVFLPGIRRGLKFREEIVRTEFLQVLAAAVAELSGYATLNEMKCLLVGGDVEANFFNNIHHIQLHRRTRALRRLADEAEAGHLSSRVLSEIFLPLIHHFFPTRPDTQVNPDLINETVQCISRISKTLNWGTWRMLVHQYLRLIRPDTPSLKAIIRTVIGILKAFHFELSESTQAPVLNHVNAFLLPQLFKTIDDREVAEETSRISLAEGAATVIAHLPHQRKEVEASGLFLSVSRILRSKEQAVRDAARTTICTIVLELGSDSLATAVKELRTALQRGPQQHVLAFTVHALLVRLFEEHKTADVSAAVEDLVSVIDTDLFGAPAKDRDSKDFRSRSTYREIKTSKSVDSLQILATLITVDYIPSLLTPIRSIIASTQSLKTLRVVDDSLSHIAQGLQANAHLDSKQLLSLCHSLLTQNSAFTKEAPRNNPSKGRVRKDYAVNNSKPSADTLGETYASNVHRFICLGLDLLNTAFRRNRFDLHDPHIIARLEPLISATGNALFSSNDLVLARALKASASLLRCPLDAVERSAPVMVKQILKILQNIGGTESEVAQAAIRALTVIIRECKTVKLGEKQLTELLQLITPDLEDAERQAILFGLLRAIMSRNFVCPEIYDLMDRIADMLVTNQSSSIRELCRAIFLQFLLDYPQGKNRLQNSLGFLARNIAYKYESGRLSTLEILHAVFTKFSPELLQETSDIFFVSLVLCVANDESAKCREAAVALIKILVQKVADERQATFLQLLVTWTQQTENVQLSSTALQVFGVYCDALDSSETGKIAASKAIDVLFPFVETAAEKLSAAQTTEAEEDFDVSQQKDWAIPYQAMQSLLKIMIRHSELVDVQKDSRKWRAVEVLLLHPHAWLRTSAARLLGAFFASNPSATLSHDESSLYYKENLVESADKMTVQLSSRLLSPSLAMQIVKNLFFIGKAVASVTNLSSKLPEGMETADSDAEDEIEAVVDKDSDPLKWLFARLARQARVSHMRRPSPYAAEKTNWALQPITILQWLAAMINHLSSEQLEPLMFIIVTPLFRILDDTSKADDQMEELQKLAHEVQELLQGKVGEQMFLRAHADVSRSISQHRQARREKMSIQVVKDPAAAAQTKVKGSDRKKLARKRKSSAYKAAREANM